MSPVMARNVAKPAGKAASRGKTFPVGALRAVRTASSASSSQRETS